ncbi:Lipoprotein-releasing system ATP-binding protein LolD 2 [Geodia barretti]|uniref:Lipoprotein-releasing system ATP-binding protein LolD 2 n=1 Tax=Geodia barretti TaxID=519541 RepID=A0AA35WFL8_GEOBA|nr:Lipoprotein-releasing system ATP-binding protein LolD 2 [Geodia barretti]
MQGELIAIVGASGSGKSTLLNILAGLDRPSAGGVWVGQRDLLNITEQSLVQYRRQDVGFVWQTTARNLLPYLNVAENMDLPMALSGRPRRLRREWSGELLAALGIGDKAGRLPHQLSGGEQQLTAIGVALANQPPLLLADEPTGELDTATAIRVFEMLRTLNRSFGVTVIIVSHYPGVAQFVDRVVHIRDGRISSETISTASYQRDGSRNEEEFLVVDDAGRLQLPQEFADRFTHRGLARLDLEDGQVTLRPSGGSPGTGQRPQE